eukprot:10616692-Heterocapsa_arctica.AAC.1
MLPGLFAPARRRCCCSRLPTWIAFDALAVAQAIRTRKSAAPPASKSGQAGQGTPGELGSPAAGQRR